MGNHMQCTGTQIYMRFTEISVCARNYIHCCLWDVIDLSMP